MMRETKERMAVRSYGTAPKEIENDTGRHVRAFLYLLGKFRDADLEVYEAMAPGYDSFARPWDTGFAKPALDRTFEILAEKAPKGCSVEPGHLPPEGARTNANEEVPPCT